MSGRYWFISDILPMTWKYNDENTLACVIRPAFYNAINEYEIFSEMPAGVGRADHAIPTTEKEKVNPAPPETRGRLG